LTVREIVETVVDLCVGREIGQKDVEVGLICAIGCVVAIIVYTKVVQKIWLGYSLRFNANDEKKEKIKKGK
jgi:Flp pilus assembly pilin Flp